MQFLKILFWCLLAFVAAAFTIGNWTWVSIKLWSGLVAEVNLPLLLFGMFLLGWLPTWAYHSAIRWRLRSRLNSIEQSLAVLRTTGNPPSPPVPVDAAAQPVTPPIVTP